ncbi:hypothetical protein [Rhizobium sp. WYJ-E13]|uniref:hypothetical protein n=1 Tax=Rhizobium sp. WYJ-E13 TaxID=2849093 RepID=UPI001C1EE195|nr:hypothetical protein [Rhizobium sp. WYJ-E13]QWW71260.1 hypothetical protein KQ933_21555 [Rhizobium sp. WYJ-E13]
MIYEKRNVTDSSTERTRFEKEAAEALNRHYRRPIAILFSWQPGQKPNTIDLRATPQVLSQDESQGPIN